MSLFTDDINTGATSVINPGARLSDISKQLLHTTYKNKENLLNKEKFKKIKNKLFDEKTGIFSGVTKYFKDQMDYLKYIFTHTECLLIFLGILLIYISQRKDKKYELYL